MSNLRAKIMITGEFGYVMNGLAALGEFIALDFETTGLRAEEDMVIDIGAIRYREGREVERFATLINPQREISGEITQLTGITNDAVATAPTIDEARAEFCAFLGDNTIMAHNARFELSFLQKIFGESFTPFMLDTYHLVSLAYPTAPSHSLEYFIRRFGLRDKELHRGLQDALDMVEVARHIDTELDKEEFAPLCAIVAYWLDPVARRAGSDTGWGWSSFFAGRHYAETPGYRNFKDLHSAERVNEIDGSLAFAPQLLKDPDFFEREYDRYRLRKGQQIMAEKSGRILREGGLYVAEAETGTGKTLAYTAAALAALAADASTPVVISTHTKALQDQFFTNELPRLQRLFEIPEIRGVAIKGMNNYVCLRKIVEELPEQERLLAGDVELLFGAAFLDYWLYCAAEGEVDDIPRPMHGNRLVQQTVWKGRADHRDCTRQQCRFFEQCFYYKKKWEADKAHIIAVNHSLLLSYPRSYPDFTRLIVDEADELWQEAIDAFSQTVSLFQLRDLYDSLLSANGLAERVCSDAATLAVSSDDRAKILDKRAALGDMHTRCMTQLNRFDTLLRSLAKDELYSLQFTLNEQWLTDEVKNAIIVEAENCKQLCFETVVLGIDLDKRLGEVEAGSEVAERQQQLRFRIDDAQRMFGALERFLEQDERAAALYVRIEQENWAIIVTPFNIGPIFAEEVLERLHATLFTSATISTAADMRDFIDATGLATLEKPLETDRFRSHFDFHRNSKLIFTKGMPPNNHPNFPAHAAALIAGAAEKLGGRTLVLFTSKDRLRRTHAELLPLLQPLGIALISHNVTNFSLQRCIEQFKNADKAVLLGARGMWKGVDIPGDDLECVMVDKMPYAVPNPFTKGLQKNLVEQYRAHAVEQGEEPNDRALTSRAWNEVDKPLMFQAFRQMFGRLIRTETDRGAMIVLDPQLQSSSLSARHKQLLALLPDVPYRLVHRDNVVRELDFLRN